MWMFSLDNFNISLMHFGYNRNFEMSWREKKQVFKILKRVLKNCEEEIVTR